MPHQSAGAARVRGHEDDERCDVTNPAVGFFREFDILDDGVQRKGRVQLAEGAAGNLLIGDRGGSDRNGQGHALIDDDADDPGLGHGGAAEGKHRQEKGAGQRKRGV